MKELTKGDRHFSLVQGLLKHDKVNVNAQCCIGNTALIWASTNGHIDIVGKLMKNEKVDVNALNQATAIIVHSAWRVKRATLELFAVYRVIAK
jgi:ankyrin repeat protein